MSETLGLTSGTAHQMGFTVVFVTTAHGLLMHRSATMSPRSMSLVLNAVTSVWMTWYVENRCLTPIPS